MGNCDLCNTTIGSSAKRHPSDEVRTAVRNGLRPDTSDPVGALASLLGQDTNAGWVQMVMADATDWALCPSCSARLDGYLGPPLRTREFQGQSVDEAKAAAEGAGIPPDKVKNLEVTHGVWVENATGEGPDADAAIKAARGGVPSAAFYVSSAEFLSTGENGELVVEAQLESIAREQWKAHAPAGATLDLCECQLAPKSGFLGIGKKPGAWKIRWSTLFKAKLYYKLPAVVTLTYWE